METVPTLVISIEVIFLEILEDFIEEITRRF